MQRARRGFINYLRIECGLLPATIEAYARDLEHLMLDLQGAAIDDPCAALPEQLIGHVRTMSSERGYNASTISRHLATIKVFFRWLLATGQIDDNPADHLDQPTKWKRLPGVLTPSQVRRLLEAPTEPENPPKGTPPLWLRDRAILELMYASGLRASEVGQIGLIDIMEKIGVVRVLGKGDKQRLVPMGQPAQRALEQYLKECRPLLITRSEPPSGVTRASSSCHAPAAPSSAYVCGRSSSTGRSRRICQRLTRTCCDIASRPTCSPAGRTCASCRNCWGTRTSPRRRSTRTSIGRACTRRYAHSTPGVKLGKPTFVSQHISKIIIECDRSIT